MGDVVAKGQKVGIMGNSGRSDGHHLHFEVGVKANAFDSCKPSQGFSGVYDPMKLLAGQGLVEDDADIAFAPFTSRSSGDFVPVLFDTFSIPFTLQVEPGQEAEIQHEQVLHLSNELTAEVGGLLSSSVTSADLIPLEHRATIIGSATGNTEPLKAIVYQRAVNRSDAEATWQVTYSFSLYQWRSWPRLIDTEMSLGCCDDVEQTIVADDCC